MKRIIYGILILFTAIFLMSCDKEKTSIEKRDVLYQVSLLQGLTLGDYDGSVSVETLKKHGDIGIGTFDQLNGELIMLDGKVYRAKADGSVELVNDEETIPFSNVTFMDTDLKVDISEIEDYEGLCAYLDQIVLERGKNHFHVIRIDGSFHTMNVRSEYAQEEPYKPLVDVLKVDQTFFDYIDLEGSIVGLCCPVYMSDLNAPGWHLHFISKDKKVGGHVLGLSIAQATLFWDDTKSFEMVLPQNEMFSNFDLSIDQSEDIKEVETAIQK